MAIKLGTLLVQTGLITLSELDEALKFQTIFGGKLGTNLIEMGLVEEEDIARLLSRKLHVPYTSSDQLLEIPPGTANLLKPELAEKFRVVPFALDKKRLHLVMMDPGDLRAVDEIGFITGYTIRPMVAPEISLVLALEKHYGIERDKRYVPVIKQVLNRKRAQPAPAGANPPREAPSPRREDARRWRESVAKHSSDRLSQALADVKDRNTLAALVLEYVGSFFETAALFLVRDQMLTGWQARAGEQPLPAFTKFSLSLDEPSVLQTVVQTRSFYVGTPPDLPANNQIRQALHVKLAETTLLLPIIKQNRVVCILYVSDSAPELKDAFFDLQKVVHKASLALDVLILRNKILMT
ncbi:general secretion pathway protein GspE [Geoalkalibacter halelectricus]|uniref:General secretion pathway protein GspE n=1 Tax=Geoalkalibacter halelectricus TaxID=2847045 RepID=A0ABY5ZT44_9BACT|nr:general secretion pathway protein GspE [Geoalkalibacter halelectricus]MDO3376903.1 general secretion pathway protein GspE [Geoalkalibacter halelectricus]UWZ81127.1 general secretion pathway protein GspE [Geoalkalibacter halelectricus]